MTKEEFSTLINGASFISFKFAQEFLKNKLIPEFRYDVYLNMSNDNPALTQFDIYPEDNERVETGLTYKEVRDLLYRKGKVPVWIDIAVHKSDRKITTFKLLCAGRYSDDKEEYYYQSGGTGPFGIKSPNLPIGYKEGKKFRLKKNR
ncbi:hypothetical protein F7018_15925 [Tenacibaculum aiptasiae]|uniref:Uncharacterized protein n=1 Tax=Tenacibaculum aiptasiae TaxID=426481 RepID=A0A7J5A8S0_9FLAO|nr:hypothetical protein [Tenacibaculum aiptasiae]KAB1153971.1 hypothetical protein F7018_15925 [Tenacibaculum aiptasiae]